MRLFSRRGSGIVPDMPPQSGAVPPPSPQAAGRPSSQVTEVTRRRLIQGLAAMGTTWSGTLDDAEFLGRLYDLDALPSTDRRFSSASGDVFMHRVMNPEDWDEDWIFHDHRFGLTDSDDALLRFLAEMLHPAVRTDLAEVEELHAFLNSVLIRDGYEIIQAGAISGAPVFTGRRIGSGVRGPMKNLIFAAIGPKPEIVLDDAVNNDLRIVRNEENCLVYDRPLAGHRLLWSELAGWWADREHLAGQPERAVWRSLHQRLRASIDASNGAELRIFDAYAKRYAAHGPDIPALLPQVYLHYDPYTKAHYQPMAPAPLQRQRMDFLLLLPHNARVVIECDGQQHYADGTGQPTTVRRHDGRRPRTAPEGLRGLPLRRRRARRHPSDTPATRDVLQPPRRTVRHLLEHPASTKTASASRPSGSHRLARAGKRSSRTLSYAGAAHGQNPSGVYRRYICPLTSRKWAGEASPAWPHTCRCQRTPCWPGRDANGATWPHAAPEGARTAGAAK
jgi:AbiJ N-terminal domain 3